MVQMPSAEPPPRIKRQRRKRSVSVIILPTPEFAPAGEAQHPPGSDRSRPTPRRFRRRAAIALHGLARPSAAVRLQETWRTYAPAEAKVHRTCWFSARRSTDRRSTTICYRVKAAGRYLSKSLRPTQPPAPDQRQETTPAKVFSR